MKEIWIRESGEIQEDQVADTLKAYCGENARDCCAYYTNRFQSSRVDGSVDERLDKLLVDCSKLLEIRIFDADSELRLYRSMIGQDFSFRIADDQTLRDHLSSQSESFLQDEKAHRMEQIQVLDADTANYPPWKNSETDAFGSRLLRTTGGGTYNLPIRDDQNAVIVISYIHYDNQGVASIADTRLAGFCNECEWRMRHENR